MAPAFLKSCCAPAWVELIDACAVASRFEKLPRGFVTMPTTPCQLRQRNFDCVAGIVRQGSVSLLRADALESVETMEVCPREMLVTDFAVETSAVDKSSLRRGLMRAD